jgi:hypothetical protein
VIVSLVLATPLLAEPVLVPDSDRAVSDARGGGATLFSLASSILGKKRRIDVVLPPSFARSSRERRYPVVIILDGEFDLAPAAAAIDQLTRNGMVPECILVAIENTDPYQGRVHDLTPPGLSVSGSGLDEGGDRFLDFIERELLPSIDARFRGGPPRVLVGHSAGGILATYAAATRPGFRAVVAIDAPIALTDNWLARKLTARAASSPSPLRFAYYAARFPWPAEAWRMLTGAAPPSWQLHQETLPREGHETMYMLAAYLGLREVFSDYSRLAAPEKPTSAILPYYDSVDSSFGARLVPPQHLLREVIDDYLMEGYGGEARRTFGLLSSGFGAPSDSADLLQQIGDAERQPRPTESVEGLLATPFPTPEEARTYIGEWIGEMWMTPNQPRKRDKILRIRVVDGKVAAEIEDQDAPEEVRIQRMEYLKVTSKGISFGMMNGMRPFGVILHEGTLAGDTLSGKTRWGGIRFTYPSGMGPPDPGFLFVRVRQ